MITKNRKKFLKTLEQFWKENEDMSEPLYLIDLLDDLASLGSEECAEAYLAMIQTEVNK